MPLHSCGGGCGCLGLCLPEACLLLGKPQLLELSQRLCSPIPPSRSPFPRRAVAGQGRKRKEGGWLGFTPGDRPGRVGKARTRDVCGRGKMLLQRSWEWSSGSRARTSDQKGGKRALLSTFCVSGAMLAALLLSLISCNKMIHYHYPPLFVWGN